MCQLNNDGLMEDIGVVKKVCPKCNAEFLCYRSSKMKCWCEDYTVAAENLKLLAEKYNNCLCPECLLLYSKKKK